MENEIPLSGISPGQIEFLKKQIEQLDADHKVDLSDYRYIFDDANRVKKETDSQYEIYINLTANILENIPGLEFPESKSVCTNNYFIPVPSGQNHHEYLKAFFDHMQNCITLSAAESETQE